MGGYKEEWMRSFRLDRFINGLIIGWIVGMDGKEGIAWMDGWIKG